MMCEAYLSEYEGKTVLVTGGDGAIGSNVTSSLAEAGAKAVLILDDLSSSEKWNIPSLPNVLLLIEDDILDGDKLKRAFLEKPDVVFHLAAFFANQKSVDHPERDFMVGVMGTLRLPEYSLSSGMEV